VSAPLRSCDTCHAIPCICWAAPITREQQRVLDAAVRWRDANPDESFGVPGELADAVDALMPHPRYYSPGNDGWIYDYTTRPNIIGVVRVHLLPVVLAALNARDAEP